MKPRKHATKKSSKKSSREQLNKHINFDREKKKSNARKWPTDVVCVKCHKKFVLPFKPRRPEVYCDDCFKNKNK